MLLILAGVTINLAVNNQGIFNKAKTATRAFKNASENEQMGLDEADKEIAKYMPKEGTEGWSGSSSSGTSGSGSSSSGTSGSGSSGSGTSGSGSSGSSGSGSESGGGTSGSGSITYTDSSGNTKPLTKDTPTSDYGTKIGNTTITNSDNEEIKLDWYLFDISDDGKTAYLVSTPTYWVPDTTKEVSGAWVPKLVSSFDSNTGAIEQALKYETNSYTPSANTLSYYKSVNSDWAKSENGRSTKNFSEWNENEKEACYLADADIFEGIKDQVNKAEGNLKGEIQTLVGGASVEQWCKAYNKQSAAKDHKITCEYSTKNVPGYIYKVNDKQSTVSNSDYGTGTNTIFGNDIYGAANNGGNKTNNPFYNNSWWWLASPSSYFSTRVCCVSGANSYLSYVDSYYYDNRVSLFASVAL